MLVFKLICIDNKGIDNKSINFRPISGSVGFLLFIRFYVLNGVFLNGVCFCLVISIRPKYHSTDRIFERNLSAFQPKNTILVHFVFFNSLTYAIFIKYFLILKLTLKCGIILQKVGFHGLFGAYLSLVRIRLLFGVFILE